jgi:gas vesicle protein
MDTGKTILTFLAGAAAGAVAALLLAPESGAKTREKIRMRAADMAGKAKEKIIEAFDAMESASEYE